MNDIGKLVTAGRPDVGEDEGKLGAKTPSGLAKTEGNKENARQLHLSKSGRLSRAVRRRSTACAGSLQRTALSWLNSLITGKIQGISPILGLKWPSCLGFRK